MDFTPSNFYRLSTATSVPNSGSGTNALAKPAGTEAASIVPGKKYSVLIPTSATFTTSFSLDDRGYTILFYAKPAPGIIVSVDGNQVRYTGHSFTMTNVVGESVEIPVRSNSARLIIFTYANDEMSLWVDGESGTISAATTSTSGPLSVALLEAGGILDNVMAVHGSLSTAQINRLLDDYNKQSQIPDHTIMMFDDNREFVMTRTVIEEKTLEPGEYGHVGLRMNEANSFKVEYSITGDVQVEINGQPWVSGMSVEEIPDAIYLASETGGTIRNLVITEYYDEDLVSGSIATYTTDRSSGTPAPTHKHDDSAANDGLTSVTLTEDAGTISGWFKAGDGSPLPGVTMANGVLTGTGLYVNGKAYSGGTVTDWYFLTKVGAATGEFTSNVPTHAIHATTETLNATQIDDLYESFLGNPVLTVQAESLTVTDGTALVISTEWSIVSSG